MSSDLRFRIRSIQRAHEPLEDDQEGGRLVRLVRGAVAKGGAPPTAVVLRGDRVDLIGLRQVVEAGVRVPWFLASLTRSRVQGAGSVDAVGVIGLSSDAAVRGAEPPVPVVSVFLEWEDCRWWQWRALVREHEVLEETEVVRRAIDGDALPEGVGRWWSLGRRLGMRIQMSRVNQDGEEAAPPLVH